MNLHNSFAFQIYWSLRARKTRTGLIQRAGSCSLFISSRSFCYASFPVPWLKVESQLLRFLGEGTGGWVPDPKLKGNRALRTFARCRKTEAHPGVGEVSGEQRLNRSVCFWASASGRHNGDYWKRN